MEGDVDETGRRTFEQALSELEARVRSLESSSVELEDALGLFEEGIELARECHEQLDRESTLHRASRPSSRSGEGPIGQG